ncbi:MAG: sensor histidine kinase, partial [Owenweeksia sp.]
LEGYHQRWYSTLMPELSLNDLPPGNYTLKLATAGTTAEYYTALPISIHPAFWQQNWFLLTVIVFSITILILIIRSLITRSKARAFRKMENRKRLAQLELEAIKAQINPHFIYNCLNSIQYFTQLGDPEKADKYIKTFAALLRQTMQISQETFITIDKEIVYLDSYLQMEKMRFKDKLSYSIHVPRELYDEKIPAMMLQPFIENAIKHGIVPLAGKGELQISFGRRGKDAIEIRIEDNGPGWKPEASPDPHLGLRLASSRADTYNQLFEMGIYVNIIDKSTSGGEQTGTIIELLIPIQHESFSYNY